MYALTIDNPELEQLAREVFSKDPVSTNAQFHRFLQQQKLRQDVEESLAQLEAGLVYPEKEAFEKLYAELGL